VADAGLELNQPEHTYNTIPAHEATIWAADQGDVEASKLRHALFEAYWVHDRNIGSSEVLQAIADEQGLDGAALRQALDAGTYRDRVWQEIEEASQYGISGVPTVVAGGYGVVGAQPYTVFEQLMETLGIPRREGD
jgi:predicted DsbA family dithiol-disulfide isomerase